MCQLVEAWLEIDVRIEGFVSRYDNCKLLQINLIEKNTWKYCDNNIWVNEYFLSHHCFKYILYVYLTFIPDWLPHNEFPVRENDVGCTLKQLNVDVNKKMLLIR